MDNRGKQFEAVFKSDWIKTFPDSFIYRLPDQVSGYKVFSQNPCDFICYNLGKLFLCECKSHRGASLPFDAIPQYERLLKHCGKPGVRAGVICWLIDKDLVFYAPIKTIEKMKQDGKKSIGIKAIEEGYNIKILPSQKKRVFLETDYSPMMDLEDWE